MSNYPQDKVEYYKEKLKKLSFYSARESMTDGILTSYLISSRDWRVTILISCNTKSAYRLNFLYVNRDNSFYFSENDFKQMSDKATAELK